MKQVAERASSSDLELPCLSEVYFEAPLLHQLFVVGFAQTFARCVAPSSIFSCVECIGQATSVMSESGTSDFGAFGFATI